MASTAPNILTYSKGLHKLSKRAILISAIITKIISSNNEGFLHNPSHVEGLEAA